MADGIKKGPRSRQSNQPSGHQIGLNLNEYQISFDKNAFNEFIDSHGITLVHYRALPDPSGMLSRGDNHAVNSTRQSSDGFLYKKAGECKVLFSNNSNKLNIETEGLIDNATAFITLPQYYSDKPKEPVLVYPWDRFYLKDVEVRVINTQLMEANSTGIDRLQYPAICVEILVDANGKQYEQDKDFILTEDGNIKWLTQNRPGWNPKIKRGKVYSIRYRYTPFFVCARLIHEIRVSQSTNPATFERTVERMPYAAQVVREHVFHDTNRDPNKPIIDERYQDAPPVGGGTGPQVT